LSIALFFMEIKQKFLAIIPARGGSKRIPKKNIALLNGKPLIQYTIEAALASRYLDKVVVSTDSEEIAQIAKNLGAQVPCLRPPELSGDNVYTLPVLQQMVAFLKEQENYQPWAVLTLQPTSPLRTAKHIDEAIELFLADPLADSLVSVVKTPHNMTPESLMKQEGAYLKNYLAQDKLVLRSQDKPTYYARNGAAIYITKTERLSEYIFGGQILPYLMSAMDSFDIDTLEDLNLIEFLMHGKN
ncbi:MAG: acylneuraminate cytidylyltransferase family protein, partial [Candidatus Gribaldobacteria bacterium]|nr:acylneuraminate cytidylyltransferase family protein [Candidatus Gribaldobacteria bacterium]